MASFIMTVYSNSCWRCAEWRVSTCTNVLSTQLSEMRHSLHVVSLLGAETGTGKGIRRVTVTIAGK
eukprot:scaffold219_cov119-Skeletonema_dohrnii-CCMP3373.AAC.2